MSHGISATSVLKKLPKFMKAVFRWRNSSVLIQFTKIKIKKILPAAVTGRFFYHQTKRDAVKASLKYCFIQRLSVLTIKFGKSDEIIISVLGICQSLIKEFFSSLRILTCKSIVTNLTHKEVLVFICVRSL